MINKVNKSSNIMFYASVKQTRLNSVLQFTYRVVWWFVYLNCIINHLMSIVCTKMVIEVILFGVFENDRSYADKDCLSRRSGLIRVSPHIIQRGKSVFRTELYLLILVSYCHYHPTSFHMHLTIIWVKQSRPIIGRNAADHSVPFTRLNRVYQ
jgi:hypothetical protein